MLRHSRTGGNPNTNTPFTPPTAEFVIPAQARIQAFDFQKRLEAVAQSNSHLRGRLTSADGDMKRPYPMDYFFRRPLRSSGHYNQHTNNQYGIGHLPPSACAGLLRHSRASENPSTNTLLKPPTAEFVIPAQAGIQASDFQKRSESVAQSNSPPLRGRLASADGDTEHPYPMDYIFRRPPQSARRWFRLPHDGGG